jgi:cysteine-rich repeat protein
MLADCIGEDCYPLPCNKDADFIAQPGVDYYVVVDGFAAGDLGVANVTVACTPLSNPDTCEEATPIECGDVIKGVDTTGFTNNYNPGAGNPCTGYSASGEDRVYVLNVTQPTLVDAAMSNQNYDGSFYVVTDCANLLADCTGADCYPPPCTKPVSFVAQPGVDYYMIVDGFGGANGTSDLSVSCSLLGETCESPEPIACGANLVGVGNAGYVNDYNLGVGNACTGYTSLGPDRVFVLNVGAIPQSVSALMNNQAPGGYDGAFYVVTDCTDIPSMLADCVGADCFPPPCPKPLNFNAAANTDYYIVMDGYAAGDIGTANISITCGALAGACCFGTKCQVLAEDDCGIQGGTYLGDGTTCAGNPCFDEGADCPLSSCAAETLTQSASINIDGLNTVACAAPTGETTANGWARCYDLNAELGVPTVVVNSLTYGVQVASMDGITVNINLYEDADCSVPSTLDALVHQEITVVNTSDAGNLITVPLPAVSVTGALTVEIEQAFDGTVPPLFAFRPRSNSQGQCGPSYIRAADCGIADFIDLSAIGFPTAHLVQSLDISCAECGNGIVEFGEECDGGDCCESDCTYTAGGTECRPSAGPCDVAESCTGGSADCPADGFANGTECRPSAGDCDPAESCDGSGAACPPDALDPAGTPCRPAAGPCDVAEVCNGQSPTCPADAKQPAGTVCDPASAPCEEDSVCDGSSNGCPPNDLITICFSGDGCCPAGAVCNANQDSDCAPSCGNGRVESGEECDDGNIDPGDGCDELCQNEAPPVPAVTTWGMMTLLVALAVGLGLVFGRRRQTA